MPETETKAMNKQAAKNLALSLLEQWNLGHVQFKWSRGKRQFGLAVFRRDGSLELRLSAPLTELNPEEEVRDVILHEIAHFLAGHAAGHGPAWRAMARKVGARPDRCNTTAATPEAKYAVVCGCCSRTVAKRNQRRMRLDNRICKHCGRESVGKLRWTINS